jgi:hypothetical protein
MPASQHLRESLFRQAVARYLAREISRSTRGAAADQERILDNRPRDVVITGVLLPRQARVDDDVAHIEFLQRTRPSTMGLTFRVPSSCEQVQVTVRGFAFVRVLPTREEQANYKRHPDTRMVFARVPVELSSVAIDLKQLTPATPLVRQFESLVPPTVVDRIKPRTAYPAGHKRFAEEPKPSTLTDAQWTEACAAVESGKDAALPRLVASLHVAVVQSGHLREVSVTVSNDSADDAKERDTDAGLFDVQLDVVLLDATAGALAPEPYVLELPVHGYLYNREQHAAGRNCNAQWDGDARVLRTVVTPTVEQRRYLPDDDVSVPFERLAGSTADAVRELRRLATLMDTYDTSEDGWGGNEKRVRAGDRKRDLEEFLAAREAFAHERATFRRGIDLLANPEFAAVGRAFQLANKTMLKLWGAAKSWRAFQIVWIVGLLPAIARREYPGHRALADVAEEDGFVEVLWFPTGGGKTEAFLGVLLVQAFFDRLRGRERGPVAFLRFPLRLLTLQQYQRLLKIVVVAEQLRIDEELGGRPFTLGMLIGKQGSPNKIDDARKERETLSTYRKVRDCPHCGQRDQIEIYFDEESLFTRHRCKSCERVLPVFVVDEDVFRAAPTFIVGTVDKLALIGWQHLIGNVLGMPYGFDPKSNTAVRCTKHGFLVKPNAGGLRCQRGDCTAQLDRVSFKDPAPSFLVVDELHLLQEDLGTFDAHYETAVMQLMASAPGGRPWKVLAATATIERYQKQVEELWCRRARRFPGSGPKAGESFYAREALNEYDGQEEIASPPRRIFMGVMPTVKTTINAAVIMLRRQYELVETLWRTRRTQGASAAAALVGCDPNEPPDDERIDAVLDEFDCTLTYVLNRKAADQLAESVRTQLSEQLRDLGVPQIALRILTSGTQTSEILETMERVDVIDKREPDPTKRIRALIATSLVSHGVDLSRLNWMMFYGMPFLVAEYIQAGSRVGRTNVGLVLVVFAPNNERDRSVYHRFAEFHRHIDALVEPSAVERELPLAFRRTVPGLLASLALQERSRATQDSAYLYDGFARLEKMDPRYSRDVTTQRLLDLVGLDAAHDGPAQHSVRERVGYLSGQIETVAMVGDQRRRRELISRGIGAMTSLRDVDEEVWFEPLEQSIAAFSATDEKIRTGEFDDQADEDD